MRWRRKRSGEGGDSGDEEASAEGVRPEEASPNGPDPRTGYWSGTEQLHEKYGPLRRLAKIGHAEPFATLEEGIDFWVSHGYRLEDRSASRAELKSAQGYGPGFWALETGGCIVGVFLWPVLILTAIVLILLAVGRARERVVLEVMPEGGVVESRSLSTFELFP